MRVKDNDRRRIDTIDHLLQVRDHVSLKHFVVAEVPRGLLGDATFNAARAMNRVATVIYLATLGVENLPPPNDRAVWLAVYQAISEQRETEALRRLPERLPIKWVTRAIVAGRTPAGQPLEVGMLRRCDRRKGALGDWLAAIELAFDCQRFDVLEALIEYRAGRKSAPRISVETWVHIASILSTRHVFAENLWKVAALARSYACIFRQLPATPPLADVRSLVAGDAARVFLQCGDYERSIAMAERCGSAKDRVRRYGLLAEACCGRGDLAAAVAWLDRIVALAVTAQALEKARSEREQAYQRASTQPAFDPETAGRALIDLQQVLDASGQKVFLVSGTLLGYARDGRLLPHDKDIDVGIMQWEDQYDVAIALLKSGRFWVRMRSIGDARTYYIPIQHLPTRTSIDIFVYHAEGGRLVTGVRHFFGHTQKFAFTPFELKQVDFLGTRVYVPDDVERNLVENFGSAWRVPDAAYLSHLESPSTVDMGGLAYQVTARLVFLKALRTGNVTKMKRVLVALRRHCQQPGGMGTTLLDELDHVCAALAA